MIKRIFSFVFAALLLLCLTACNPTSTPESPGSPPSAGETASLTETEARKAAQAWIDGNPFQFSAGLEPEYDELTVDNADYYRFYLGIERFGVAEILVHKETGELFHFESPGCDIFQPIDDWYYQNHRMP